MSTGNDQALLAGGWCWFHAPRAVQWGGGTALGLVMAGPTVQADDGTVRRSGQVAIAVVTDGHHEVVHLGTSPILDDHCAPAVAVDGADLLVGWTGHATGPTVHLARVRRRQEGLEVVPVADVDLGQATTYVSFLPAPAGAYRFVTRARRVAHVVVDIERATGRAIRRAPLLWHDAAPEDPHSSGRDGGRPYAVYRSAGSRGWFAATDDHPRAYRSAVWCGFLDGDTLHDAAGRPVRRLSWQEMDVPLVRPSSDAFAGLSCALPRGREAIPWVHDLAITPQGRPVIALTTSSRSDEQFRARRDVDSERMAYVVAALDADGNWSTLDLAPAGSALCDGEGDYAGGIALDPDDPGWAVLSADILPAGAGAQSVHRIIVADLHGPEPRFLRLGGEEEPRSLRPVVSSQGAGGHALAYLVGDYRHYTDYDLTVRVVPFEPGRSCWDGPDGHVDLPFGIGPGDGMPPEETDELLRHLRDARSYLEYGAGVSTLLALRASAATVTSVESDRGAVRAVVAAADEVGARRRLDARDAGWPVSGEWGYPLTGDAAVWGRGYVERADDVLPDLVLIDGRFRVACFLHTVARLRGPAVILWDDYRWRRHYHEVEKYLRPVRTVGRLAVFEVDGPVHVTPQDYASALQSPG